MVFFGATLKLLRTEAGLSLRELSRRVGVSSAYLSRVENDRDPPPTPDRLIAIAEALGLSADLIIELAHQTAPALVGYIEDVPAAGSFFLEVARRRLDAEQLGRLRELMDDELPEAGGVAPMLSSAIGGRLILDLQCQSMGELIDAAIAQLARSDGEVDELARLIHERERISPTALGRGVAVPHAVVPGASTTATLVTLAEPLDYPSPDGEPIRLAVVLVSGAPGHAHLELLARIARLASRGVASELRRARTARAIVSIIKRIEGASLG
jgi:PTS system nitrogen regulatory IIA component